MKSFRCAVVSMCVLLFILTAAPPISAGSIWERDRAVAESPTGFMARWLERIAEWIGWGGDDEPRSLVQPNGCGIGPDGAPCK